MEIVVDVPDEEYDSYALAITFGMGSKAIKRILEGTPLPKGHGRLIDGDKFDARMYQKAFIDDTDMQKWDSGCWIRYKMYEIVRDSMSTVIEADKEGAEE